MGDGGVTTKATGFGVEGTLDGKCRRHSIDEFSGNLLQWENMLL